MPVAGCCIPVVSRDEAKIASQQKAVKDIYLSLPCSFILNTIMRYAISQVADGVHTITEPDYKEHANMFLFSSGGTNLLIDSGVGLTDVRAFLDAHGFHDTVVTVTHCHFDHVGGLRYFSPDRIILPSIIHANIYDPASYAVEHFDPADVGGPFPKDALERYMVEIPTVEPYVRETIDVGEFHFRIISAPGHTNDSVVYFDERAKILVTGDTLYEGKRYDHLSNSNKKTYIQTLECLRALPVDIVLPGHNRVLSGDEARDLMGKWIAELKKEEGGSDG